MFIKYEKKVILHFEQAKFIELIEFSEVIQWHWVNIIIWLLKFIRDHSSHKLTKHEEEYVMGEYEVLIEKIKNTFFEWCFEQKKDNWDNSEVLNPLSSYITVLSEKLQQDPLYILNNYTIPQLDFLTEWLVWNSNEMTDEWKKKNKLSIIAKKAQSRTVEEEEKIREILKRFD